MATCDAELNCWLLGCWNLRTCRHAGMRVLFVNSIERSLDLYLLVFGQFPKLNLLLPPVRRAINQHWDIKRRGCDVPPLTNKLLQRRVKVHHGKFPAPVLQDQSVDFLAIPDQSDYFSVFHCDSPLWFSIKKAARCGPVML